MTWDPRQSANKPKPGASQPSGWDGPSWWDETGVPARKTASAVRSAAPGTIRGTVANAPTTNGSGNGSHGSGNGSHSGVASASVGPTAAKRARSRAASTPRSIDTMATIRLVGGFVLGSVGFLFLAAFVAFGLSRAYEGKIMPGVHVGALDVSGLTRDEAVAKIDAAYASLSKGAVTITTPAGTDTITYEQAGRGPDSAAMADAALSVGHGENPLTGTASTIRTFAGGVEIPVIVKLDPLALETKLRSMTQSSQVAPKDATVAAEGSSFKVMSATPGSGIDETTIATGLIDALASSEAPSELMVGGKFIPVEPNVSDNEAQTAIDSANKMAADLTLTYSDKTWKVDAATIRSWLIFGVRTDGTFGPVVNPAMVKTYVNTLSKDVMVKPVEPNIVYTNNKPTGVKGGVPGQELDVDGTSQAIESYLDALGSGGATSGSSIALVVNVTQPTITQNMTLTGFSVVGEWHVTYFPDESNGFGKNINQPAVNLNGRVIQAGEHFSFLKAVGPIDPAHGFALGGVIKNGQSNHTGAMGGGICSASTTFFNAAANAGLQIDERHAHFYHITRYPMGLDATVYSNGYTTWDMRFTNDTANPIVIRSWTAGTRSKRVIHVEFWSVATGRVTTYKTSGLSNYVKAANNTQYVPAGLPGGAKSIHKEYATDGFDVNVKRTVVDKLGNTVHYDSWSSHYTKVDGLLQIAGAAPTPTPTPGPPTPKPTPKPTPPPPTPTPTAAIFPLSLLPLLLIAAAPGIRRRYHRK